MTECPYCGDASGYYRKTKITGMSQTNYDFDGKISEDNSMLHDSLDYHEYKKTYCQNCNREIKIK